MNSGRWDHTATSMPDGRVLVAGGLAGYDEVIARAEIYDPAGVAPPVPWAPTGSMAIVRGCVAAAPLLDGRVLAAGGCVYRTSLATAELYDPASGQWALTGSMSTARSGHTATPLLDGRVLVTGGRPGAWSYPVSSAEVYDPSSGEWTSTGSMNLARELHTATLLLDGRVLVVGGYELPGPECSRQRGGVRPCHRAVGSHGQTWTMAAGATRRRCCRTGGCWWRGVTKMRTCPLCPVRSCGTRPPGSGRPPPA